MADDTDGSLRSRVRAVLTQRTVDTEVAAPGPHGPRAATAYAWWMLMIVPGVHQLESHVLQPLLMGSAVEVHPLAVVLAVAGGAMVAGIPGALFAVPLAAFVTVYITRRAWETDASVTDTDLIWTRVPRTRKGRA